MIIYGETSDGDIEGYDSSSYAAARSTATDCFSISEEGDLGQKKVGASYTVYRGYLSFPTSDIPDEATVTSATLYVCAWADLSGTDFLIQVYRYPWQEPLCDNREANYDGAYGGSATF